MKDEISKLVDIIKESNNIVFFGGAGVSTESGIPDFRSKDGLYNQKYSKDPEYMLSKNCFYNEPEEFYKFYFDKMIFKNIEPNDCHKALKKLEELGKLQAIITQNIDGLHQKAGSTNVIELHGNVNQLKCLNCDKEYELNSIKHESVPKCNCGGVLKPEVVLYGEQLNNEDLNKAIYYINNCDTLIVGGTSLVVYPAAGLLNYFMGYNLILINKEKTPFDVQANLVIHEPIGKVFKKVMKELSK